MTPLVTARLRLRLLSRADAAFWLELVNEADWLRFIGDRGIRTLADAEAAIVAGPMTMQTTRGFSFYAVERAGTPIGICGLTKRDGLDDVDLGFAFLAAHRGAGHAEEAARAVMAHAARDLGLRRLAAITSLDNLRSIRLLEALGFRFEGVIRLPVDRDVRLFGWEVTGP